MNPPTQPLARLSLMLKIGRVSNLPTVWTNVVAGAFLAGVATDTVTLLWLMLAVTLFYTGGMYLNDAFGNHPAFRFIPMHHEQTASMAAEGYARIAGQIGRAHV